ncbi:putative GPI-anchored cupredoxin [Hyphodiscus hymeniophilus]|uniref:GPI-anchored cupredoxin n=1 Tax=Hyphodiscus hymeniophilus TaxID=353542 RepID=A0A9P6VH82_9HELO|nr:putative GPI-anchored cupredoxin [Hyphodiscus hymeniophilus]
MLFSSKALIAACLPLALAQYGPPPAAPKSSTSAAAAKAPASTTASSTNGVQTIAVGANNGFAFTPNSLTAAVGSSIEFNFNPPEHSVVEGSFASPCVPANNSAFYSGGQTSSSTAFTIVVNSTDPIWFFCGFPGHCGLGMVGVINPPSDGSQTVAQFAAAAAKVQSPPTITLPVQGGIVGPVKAVSAPSSSSSAASSASAASASPTTGAATRGMDVAGSAQWFVIALTGVLALGVGTLIM